jgi:hypothetical protein
MKKILIFFAAISMLVSMGYATQTAKDVMVGASPEYIIQFGPSAALELGGIVYPNADPTAENFVTVPAGTATYAFTILPDVGYLIDKVYVDNIINTAAALTGSFTFLNVMANHTIYATFKPTMVPITATAGPNGTITPNGTFLASYGSTPTFQALPNAGAYVTDIVVDGNSTGLTDTYTFDPVTTSHTIMALFAKNSYTITTTPLGQGEITPPNPVVEHGDNKTLSFVPNEGYKVSQVKIDGVDNPTAVEAGSFTFTNVTANHTIEVTFAKINLTITASHTTGGVIADPPGPGIAYVEYGAHSLSYVFDAQEGYHVKSAIIDGQNNALAVYNGFHRFMNVTANHTIHVVFEPDNFTIVATANEGGDINPQGIVTVPNGTDQVFRFAPQEGYDLVRVIVNGENNLEAVATGVYSFSEVSDNNIIAAQFEKKMYDVIYQPVPGALVAPVNSTSPVAYNGTYKFEVTLEEGYSQSDIKVYVNGILLNPDNNGIYSITNIFGHKTIQIQNVVLNKYQIVAQAYSGGTITPAGTFTVTHGDNKTFEIIPNAQFQVKEVMVDGASVGAPTTYTFFDIRGNATIKAYFTVPLGIDDIDPVVTVYSNYNVVTILNNGLLVPIKQVEIMDMYGRLIWKGQALTQTTEIPLDVAAGIYAVRITTETTTTTTKVTITK